MSMEGYYFPIGPPQPRQFATTSRTPRLAKAPKLSRAPALLRSRRTGSTSSTSTASISSIPSPVLLTPTHDSGIRSRVPPARLDHNKRKAIVGDVYEEDERDPDMLSADLLGVLNLTPRPMQSAFTPFPFCDSPTDSQAEDARPDDSPTLLAQTEWTLPVVPKLAPIRLTPSQSLLRVDIPSRRASIHDDTEMDSAPSVAECAEDEAKGIMSVPSGPTSYQPLPPAAGPKAFHSHASDPCAQQAANYIDGHRPSNTSSIISSVSSASSQRSLRSTLSNPPSIPDRTSSRKRPSLPSRGSSLKPSRPLVHFAPPPSSSPATPARRRSTSSVVSLESVLDPHPILPSSTSTPLSTPHPAHRPRKSQRASSFTSSPLSPRSPIDFSALAFTGLDDCERFHLLHRTSSTPYLRSWRVTSDMPSAPPPRFDRAPRTPKTANSSRVSNLDFSASPNRPRRPPLFTSPKPSSSAIEHIAPRRQQSDRVSQEVVIPIYDSPSPRACVRVRPVPAARRNFKAAEDLYSECKKADKLEKLIGRAGVNEAAEAIREAESWLWARPPPREGRMVKFVGVPQDTQSHSRQASEASYHSSQGGSGSDMGLSESHSVGTISEETEVITPSSSNAFLTVPLPTIVDPTTPTAAHGPLLPEAEITPKAPIRTGASILRTSSQNGSLDSSSSLPIGSETKPQKPITKRSMSDLRMKEQGSGWKRSLGKSGVKAEKKEKSKPWFDLHAFGAPNLM